MKSSFDRQKQHNNSPAQLIEMDIAKQHWHILRELGPDLANRVRSFMVVGWSGDGLFVVTEDGEAFWLGTMKFRSNRSKTATKPIPLNVPGLVVVQMVQSHDHILFLSKRGQIYSIEINYAGLMRLGKDNKEICFTPKLISIPHKVITVRCGKLHSLALTENGKCWVWGNNKFGQIGLPSFDEFFLSYRQIHELDRHRVVAIECGGFHSLTLTDRGDVYAWGGNNHRQLGYESESSTHIPTRIRSPSPVKSIAAGSHHTLLLTQTGEVYACGSNQYGELGLPTTTNSRLRLSKVAGLPSISQIASHPFTYLSIAMSFDQQCFVWGQLHNQTSISTPRKLPPDYTTLESPFSFYSTDRSTPNSVLVPETLPSRLSARMSRMFDNPETSDVQFVVEQQRTIHAHRNILSNSSDYFARLFSERWMAPVDPEDPIIKVTIPDVSYEAFHAFLRFLYTDCFKIHLNLLPELFELANQYLESDLQQLCIRRMRATLTLATCCHYYPLTHRHSLPELDVFQQELVQFVSTRMSEVVHSVAYQSMESDLRDNLTNAVGNFLSN